MHYLPMLRVFFANGIYNDYRLHEDHVEFLPHDGSHWRVLDDSDLQLHFRFNTLVSKWLREHALDGKLRRNTTGKGKRGRAVGASLSRK